MMTIKTPIYQTAQIRECERLAEERYGIAGFSLMQRAGKAAFDFLLRRFPQVQKIAVFCGNGNNGGDGYTLAQLAHERGVSVVIWQVGAHENMKAEAAQAKEACVQANVAMHPFAETADFGHPDVVVDAVCGMGVHDDMRGDVLGVIKRMQNLAAPILAIDVPTGIDADTGRLLGAAIRATATITFIGLKLGLLTGSGVSYTGELVLNDLQLPSDLFSYVEPVAKKIHLSVYADYLKARPRDWHKGLSGHVLIIGGDIGYSGAPRMAALAALRVGAGLVSVATQPAHAAFLNSNYPEIMCHPVNDATDLEPLMQKADVIVLGPGLGLSAWSKKLWAHVLAHEATIVLDADGLNLLAEDNRSYDNWVLTPHPGEAARLLGSTVQQIQQDRLEAIKAISKRYGGTCVLKGAGSLVLTPNALPALCDKGNPGMASAGMGDVLSGVIGGLIAQGIPLSDAAKLGVLIHAMAGDLAAKEGERGMIATDLLPYLRRLCN